MELKEDWDCMTTPRIHIDISVVLTLHNEGRIAHRTCRALHRAVNFARDRGKAVEVIAVLDRAADRVLVEVAKDWQHKFTCDFDCIAVDHGDLSLARNSGVSRSVGDFISILDGDDLYGSEWLYRAHEAVSSNPNAIAHPEALLYFPIQPYMVRFNPDPRVFLDLIVHNRWTALLMAHRSLFLRMPYREHADRYTAEDWLWNCETAAAGHEHVLISNTFMGIRQKPATESLWARSAEQKRTVRANALFRSILLMEYEKDIAALAGCELSEVGANRRTEFLACLRSLIAQHLYREHRKLHKALFSAVDHLSDRIRAFRVGYPSWVKDEMRRLSEIEPVLKTIRRPPVRKPGVITRIPMVVNPAMAMLVKADKPAVFVLPSLGGEAAVNSLPYIYTANQSIFVITTEDSRTEYLRSLPEAAVHVDMRGTYLSYEQQLHLTHRLLLEADPGFIHVIDSPMTFEMLDRYGGTFEGVNLFGSFLKPIETGLRPQVGPLLSDFTSLLDCFQGISTYDRDLAEWIVGTLGIPESSVFRHRLALPPSVQAEVFNPANRDKELLSEAKLDAPWVVGRETATTGDSSQAERRWEEFRSQALEFYGIDH
ncbi:glycosyltransferase [Thermodesulfobacteriota bacterium]